MPRNIIGKSPFPVKTIETDQPLALDDITSKLGKARGISLCVRTNSGHKNRGGYFFHIEKTDDDFCIIDFEKNLIAKLTARQLVRFINHVSGRQFDTEMLTFCQNVVNFKQDQNEND